MAISMSSYGNINVPKVSLGSKVLKRVSSHKYLGAIITQDLVDDDDIERQTHAIYVRGNVLIQKFKHCSEQVKLKLFQSYCSTFYMSHLWCNNKRETEQSLKVAYNNVFRKLMGIRRDTSIFGVLFVAMYMVLIR